MSKPPSKPLSKAIVSVVTPCFNSSKTIERCVRSVAAQSHSALEHILVDDGSTDDTWDRLDFLSREFGHVSIFRQSKQGAGAARNIGVSAAQGRYVAYLDGDDVWRANKLQSQIDFMEETGALFTYGDYYVADGLSGKLLGRFCTPEFLTYKELLARCPIACSTVAYNQEALGKNFMPDIRRGQDWALWLSLTRNGLLASRYPGCCVIYNKFAGSLSGKKARKALDIYKIYRREEGLGVLGSAYYLACHTINVFTKKPNQIAKL